MPRNLPKVFPAILDEIQRAFDELIPASDGAFVLDYRWVPTHSFTALLRGQNGHLLRCILLSLRSS